MPDPEQRLARLEELSFFQEEQLRQLNAALTAQQTQLDKVERDLAAANGPTALAQQSQAMERPTT